MFRILALVSLGGVIGAVSRALIEQAWPHTPGTIGWATFVINLTGSFLIGVLLALLDRFRPDQVYLRPFFGVGMLGGYTTFSTHIVEVQQLLDHEQFVAAFGILFLQVITAVIAVAAGMRLVERQVRRWAP
jgi:CrcB protein